MELDELKSTWQKGNRQPEEVIFRAGAQAERRLGGMRRLVAYELLSGLAAACLLGSFWWRERGDLQFFIPAAVLHLVAIGTVIAGIWQLATLGEESPAESVLTYQSRLRRVRLFRTRMTQLLLLTGPLLWLPLLIVFFKGVLGVNLYPIVGPLYVGVSLAFGLLFIPVAYLLCRALGGRWQGRPAMTVLMDDLGGRSLSAALRELQEVRAFGPDSK